MDDLNDMDDMDDMNDMNDDEFIDNPNESDEFIASPSSKSKRIRDARKKIDDYFYEKALKEKLRQENIFWDVNEYK